MGGLGVKNVPYLVLLLKDYLDSRLFLDISTQDL